MRPRVTAQRESAISCLLVLILSGLHAEAAPYSDRVLLDSPLGYYRMGEAAGTTALDSAGTPQNGTYVDGPLLNQAGPQSPAFPGFEATNAAPSFDGTGDHVFNSGLPFTSINHSAEGWVFNTRPYTGGGSTPIAGYVLARGTSTGFDALGLWGNAGGGNPGRLFLFNNAEVLQGPHFVTENQWHQVVYTHTGTTANIYLDGALEATDTSFANPVNSSDFYIGQRPLSPQFPTQGRIDEVSVYDNTALTGKQINSHYNAAFSTGLYSINNSAFELQNVDDPAPSENQFGPPGNGAFSQQLAQGWAGTITGANGFWGVFDPTDAEYAGATAELSAIPGGNGDQVGYITTVNAGVVVTVAQTLPDLIQAGTYDFTLAVGSRLNRGSAGYRISLFANDTEQVFEQDALNLDALGIDGILQDRTIQLIVPAGSPLIGQLLTMQISETNTTSSDVLSTDFDNARLTFIPIPEPSTLALIMFGLPLLTRGGRSLRTRSGGQAS